MAHYTLELFSPSYTVYLLYFTQVKNAKQIQENLEKFDCAFINPRLVVSVQQILFACNRALFEKFNNTSKTQSLYSDVIYYMSPSSNIGEAINHYGLQEATEEVIVASFNPETLETVKTAIDGVVSNILQTAEKVQVKKIQEVFKLKDCELWIDRNLANSVLSVLSIKDVEEKD